MAASLHRTIVVISVLAAVALRAFCAEDSSRRDRPQKHERDVSNRGGGRDSSRREQDKEHEPSTRGAGKTRKDNGPASEEPASVHEQGNADCECREHSLHGSASKAKGAQGWNAEQKGDGEKHGKARGQGWTEEAGDDDDRAFHNATWNQMRDRDEDIHEGPRSKAEEHISHESNRTEYDDDRAFHNASWNQTRGHDEDFHLSPHSKAEEHMPHKSKRGCDCTHMGEKNMSVGKHEETHTREEGKGLAGTSSRRCKDQSGDSKRGGRFLQQQDPNGDCEEDEAGTPMVFLVGVVGAVIAALCIWSGLVYVCCRRSVKAPAKPVTVTGVITNDATGGVVVGNPVAGEVVTVVAPSV